MLPPLNDPRGQPRWVQHGGSKVALIGLLLLTLLGCAKPEEKAEASYRQAVALIAEGKDWQARPVLHESVKNKSDKIEAWRALAGVDERTGETRGLFRDLQQIITLDPSDDEAKIKLAKLMLRGAAADAALKVIESVARQDANAEFHSTKAAILAALKDRSGAVQEARKAVEIDATNADAALILSSERAGRNDLTEALQILNRAKITDPKDQRIALAKVQLLQQMGNLPQLETELRALVDNNPKDNISRQKLAQVLASQRKFEDAEKEFRALAEGNPTDSKLGLDLVRFIFVAKGPDAGRQELKARISKGGEVFPYQMALVDLEIGQKNAAEATRLLELLISETKVQADKNTVLVRLAELKASQKNTAGAEKLIGEVLNGDRRNVGALRLRAVIRLDRNEVDAAIADVREALNEQPKSPELLLLLAQAYERNGQNELADRQYSDAVKSSELNPAVVLRYVAFLQRSENSARAEEVLTEAGRKNPTSVDVFSSLARVRLSRKNWSGAIEIADAMGRNDATKALADQIRAAAYAGQNKPEESLAALEKVHAEAPNALSPVVSLVRVYAAQKNYDKAEKLLQEMIAKHPTSAQLLVLSGQLQLAKGVPAEAQKAFQAAVTQAPKDPTGYTALAEFYARRQDVDKALGVLEEGLREAPGNSNLRLTKASLLGMKGDHDTAIAEFEAILKDQPASLVAINNLASTILDYRTDKQSLERAQSLVENLKSAKAPQFLDTIGWAAHMRGDDSAALPLLEQAKAQLPDNAAVRYHLGIVYRALGQEPKAIEELKAAAVLQTEDDTLKKKIQSALN